MVSTEYRRRSEGRVGKFQGSAVPHFNLVLLAWHPQDESRGQANVRFGLPELFLRNGPD